MKNIFIILLFLSFAVKAQYTLSGKVLDSDSKQPIPHVNVFFANTFIGTVTNEQGEFTIKNISSGKYDLTASMVGYNIAQQPIDFAGGDQQITLYLAEQVITLKEVNVQADTTQWRSNYHMFKELFLGTTQNAAKTVIKNPKSLYLYFDPTDRVLVAYGKRGDIEIENRALGYKVFYQLVDFSIDYKSGRMEYFGVPRFELLTPKGKGEQKRWEAERKRSYNGSFGHFIQSLKQDKLEENGFEMYAMFRVPNRERPSDEFLNERINFWREKLMNASGAVIIMGTPSSRKDSLGYYMEKKQMPKLVDSIGHKLFVRDMFAAGSNDLIKYKGLLHIIYKNEKEEENYARRGEAKKMQFSTVHFLGNKLKIYDNGYYEDVRDVFFEGYMGWSEKLAELLPLEYFPDEK